MLWLATALVILSVLSFAAGFVLFANGTGVAPHRRTPADPTGVRRAATRVTWPDLFRGMPRCVRVILDENANRSDRLAAAGSFLVLVAIAAGCIAILGYIAAFL